MLRVAKDTDNLLARKEARLINIWAGQGDVGRGAGKVNSAIGS
jgi:hypothetical protein